MPNILLTSVGRRVELVRAFRQALSQRSDLGRIVATDVDWMAPAMQLVDRPILVPRSSSDEYIPTLEAICRNEKIDLVLPLIDPDIPVLSAHRQRLESTGAKLAVVDESAALIAGDKWAAFQFFKGLNLSTPQSWLPESTQFREDQFPLFIKPRGGSAAENTFRVNNSDEMTLLIKRIESPVVQELLFGPEITCDVIADLKGETLAVVQRQRIAVRGGEATKSRTVCIPGLEDACRRIARKLPAVGPITVQCMMKEDQPHFIEINARLGGGLPLAIAAGLPVPTILSAMAAGDDPSQYVTPHQLGVTMTRFDDSIFLTDDDRQRLESSYL